MIVYPPESYLKSIVLNGSELEFKMRKSQFRPQSQQVSLNSYFQPRSVSATKTGATNNFEDAKAQDEFRNSESLMKSTYLKRSSTEEDKNPAVAKKRRQLPNTVVLSKPGKSYSSSSTPPAFPERSEKGKTVSVSSSSPASIDESKLEKARQSYHLSYSQKRALDAILQRKSVFYTGAAGTGKSYILKVLLDVLDILELSSKVAITAPTGVAACNIRGLTIHSWSGIGLGSESLENLLPIVMKNRYAKQRWLDTEILIIDEISMLSGELFDKLDFIGRRIRNSLLPFGGIQLILCGDFFQLPPIGIGKQTSFCFESNGWKELFGQPDVQSLREGSGEVVLLDKVFRQRNDLPFLNLLNSLRKGQVSLEAREILLRKVHESQLQRQEEEEEDQQRQVLLQSLANHPESNLSASEQEILSQTKIRPTKLFSTNNDVDSYNLKELQRLQAEDNPVMYHAIDEGKDPYLGQLRAGTKAPQTLVLKPGAQVMLLKNLNTEEGLVNGTRGTVIGFEKTDRSPYYPRLPIVKFQVMMGGHASEVVVTLTHDTWDIKLGDRILASRIQIPLILAWAISIHKAQGMTIPFLEVSFNRIFEYGQAYVALSRATSLEGLILTGFSPAAVKAHPKVIHFYNNLVQTKERSNPQQEDAVFEITLLELIKQFQPLKPMMADPEEWLESRNHPNKVSSNTIVEKKSLGVVQEERDEWLEKRLVVSVVKKDPIIVTEYKPNRFSQEPIVLSGDEEEEEEKEEGESHKSRNTASFQYDLPESSVTPSRRTTIYGDTTRHNKASIESLSIGEDVKRRIEENRQAALKKLAQLRQRQEEEKRKLLASYSL